MDYIYGNINSGNIDYTGVKTSTAEIVVDNGKRTIACNVGENVGFDVRKTLPKDSSGNYIDGDYSLVVSIQNNVPTFLWTRLARGSVFYGVTDATEITADVIKKLTIAGSTKQTYECVYSPKKQVNIFAYPESFGPLSKIVHKESGIPVISAWDVNTVDLEGLKYLVYSTQKTTGTFTYTFTY